MITATVCVVSRDHVRAFDGTEAMIADGACVLDWIHADNRRSAGMVNERCSGRCRLNNVRLKHGLVRCSLCKQTSCQLIKIKESVNAQGPNKKQRKKQTEMISD